MYCQKNAETTLEYFRWAQSQTIFELISPVYDPLSLLVNNMQTQKLQNPLKDMSIDVIEPLVDSSVEIVNIYTSVRLLRQLILKVW